jgi:integrase/recombinase XerC
MTDDTKQLVRRAPVGLAPVAPPLLADDLIQDFLSRRSENTRRAYDGDLQKFAEFMDAPTPAAAVDALIALGPARANHMLARYRDHMAKANLAPATRNRRIAAIRAAIKLARKLGMLTWTLEVENERSRAYRETAGPGEAAFAKMLKRAGPRDAAIICLLHDLGLRRAEAISLDLEHVDLKAGKVSVLGKGKVERHQMTLAPETKSALAKWIALRGDAPGPLFFGTRGRAKGGRLTGSSVYSLVKALGREARIGRVTPHGLRHTAITEALELTHGDIQKVQKFSRHANVQTVLLYDDQRRDQAGEVSAMVAAARSRPKGKEPAANRSANTK